MSRFTCCAAVAGLAALGVFAGCGGNTGVAKLAIAPSALRIDAEGQTAEILIEAIDESGGKGRGDVTLTASAGLFGETPKEITLTLDESGKATTTFSCAD